jgi:hypothetical protein
MQPAMTVVPIKRRQVLKDDDAFVAVMGRVVAEINRETDAKIAAFEAKISGLQAAMQEFAYKGAWTERQYRTGNFVSMGGQVYHANADTTSRPGSDSSWTLAVKSGRDGRDGKDGAAPTELPASRTVRSHR